jgi:hypothetical protein
MNDTDTITLTRQQLYEQVWSMPMMHLAKTLHLSDVGLAKVCRKHLIPYPPRGYWAKKQHGKRVRQSPLPLCDDPELQSIRFFKNAPKPDAPAVPVPEPEYDPDVVKVLEKVRTIEKVEVKTELRNPHSLVRSTKDGLRRATPDEHKLLFPRRDEDDAMLNVLVAQESIQRAMLYLDTLIKTFEKIGGCVEIKKERWQSETRIKILGESPMQLRLRERYKQKEKPKQDRTGPWHWHRMDYFPSGLFVLEGNPNWHWYVLCQDGKRSRVEDRILETISDWVAGIGKGRIARRQAEEARQVQEEKDRIRRQQEQELQRRRANLEQKQKLERERVESLLREANSWYQSKSLREYLVAAERQALDQHGKIEEGSELFRWLEWARQQADRLDPLTPTPPSILDERIA